MCEVSDHLSLIDEDLKDFFESRNLDGIHTDQLSKIVLRYSILKPERHLLYIPETTKRVKNTFAHSVQSR